MKILNLLIVALFTCTLGLSALSENTYAASTKQEVTASSDNGKNQIVQDVNINTADQELLIQLPGIGPATAGKIIEYRTTNGKFKSIDELTEVKGIGDKTLAKLKPYLYKL